jgi:hypothetical protein
MNVLRYPKWQASCQAALLEPDPVKLFQRVIVEENAMLRPIHDFAGSPENIELAAIANMLKSVRCLVASAFMLPDGQERHETALRHSNNRLKPN